MVPVTPKVPILEKDLFESAFMCFCPLKWQNYDAG